MDQAGIVHVEQPSNRRERKREVHPGALVGAFTGPQEERAKP